MYDIRFTVRYNYTDYPFAYGSEVYIFHVGIERGMDKKYGMETLLYFVQFVQACYLRDSFVTPLGCLAEYVADRWETVKNMNKNKLLENFYMEYNTI